MWLLLLLLLLLGILRLRRRKAWTALSSLSRHYASEEVAGAMSNRRRGRLWRWCATMTMGGTRL